MLAGWINGNYPYWKLIKSKSLKLAFIYIRYFLFIASYQTALVMMRYPITFRENVTWKKTKSKKIPRTSYWYQINNNDKITICWMLADSAPRSADSAPSTWLTVGSERELEELLTLPLCILLPSRSTAGRWAERTALLNTFSEFFFIFHVLYLCYGH